MKLSKVMALLALVATLVCGARPVGAESEQVDAAKAAKVKAAWMHRVASFTVWPEAAFKDSKELKAPLVITILGDDPYGVGKTMQEAVAEGKLPPVQGRAIEVRQLVYVAKPGASRDAPDDPRKVAARAEFEAQIRASHLVFFTNAACPGWRDVREVVAERPILTFSEFDGFATGAGMIEFTIVNDTVGMKINYDLVQKAGMSIRSTVLQLKIVTIVKASSGRARDTFGALAVGGD